MSLDEGKAVEELLDACVAQILDSMATCWEMGGACLL